jgi:carbonic anhydrase
MPLLSSTKTMPFSTSKPLLRRCLMHRSGSCRSCGIGSHSIGCSCCSSRTRTFTTSSEEDPAIAELLANNRKWVDEVNAKDATFFPKLGAGQAPKYLYIGCADSRVAVGNLMGIEMGDVFIHRNIANMVVASDLSFLSVLSYAVDYLKVQHILVTGHYECGGVKAAATPAAKGQILDAWLQNIRDVYRLHKHELESINDEQLQHRRMVELNVQEQCLNVFKTSIVQRRRKEENKPEIHGMVFDPSTGVLKKLPINFPVILSHEINDTYTLF